MADDEALGPGTIMFTASGVADGTATPDEAQRLLEGFVRQASADNVAPRLIDHVHDCLVAYVQGKRLAFPPVPVGAPEISGPPLPQIVKSMDEAFGLARGRGQPAIGHDVRAEVAMQVLAARLAGKSQEDALGKVADARKAAKLPIHGDTQVRDAWKTHRVMGYICFVVRA